MAKKVIVTGVTETTVQETGANNEFETVLYDGSETGQTITANNLNGSLDFAWIKCRTSAHGNAIFDTVRGDSDGWLYTDTTDASSGNGASLTFNGDNSFTLSNGYNINDNGGDAYVAWCASLPNHNPSNTDGSITSETKANSFMSVVSWSGTNNTATNVGHSLTSTPELVIAKSRSTVDSWGVWHKDLGGANKYLFLNSTQAVATASSVFPTIPDATKIYLGTSGTNNSTSHIAYCFASVAGKCKVGRYNGTDSAGNAVDCGFEPAWVMIKRTDSTGSWYIADNERGDLAELKADSSDAEYSPENFPEFTSTGFTARSARHNESGGTYIYIAIAKDTLQDTQQYDLTFAEQASAPTGVSLPSKEVLVSTTETYNPTDNDFDVVGTATKSGRAMKINLVAEEADTTITTNPVVNPNEEP
jgi:hypothetical protein